MTATWVLTAASLFAMSAGSLLFFLGLWEEPRATENDVPPTQRNAYLKRRRLLAVGGGLMSLWFLVQYLWLILA